MEEPYTRADIDRIVKEEVQRQLKEQKTDEMKAINVNVGSQDVLDRLVKLEQNQTEIFNGLSQRIVDEGNEIVERIEALFIKYSRPGGNGHAKES